MSNLDKKLAKTIKQLRLESGLSQEKLASMLKIARPIISQIERGNRKISVEELIKLSEIFNVPIQNLLDLEKLPEIILNETHTPKKANLRMRISVPQKNLEKFKQVFLYILNRVGSKPNIGETVIYKLLYFIDFDYYELYEEQLIGASYIKNTYGPTPLEFKKICDKMIEQKEITKVENTYFDYPQIKYLPLKETNLQILMASEIKLIDSVLEKLSDMNAAQISEYSHKDVPWLTTKDGTIIEYESVFYRTIPYSVRKYDEDISDD
jgi:transcriptional regulator with XRE-family HTH domain